MTGVNQTLERVVRAEMRRRETARRPDADAPNSGPGRTPEMSSEQQRTSACPAARVRRAGGGHQARLTAAEEIGLAERIAQGDLSAKKEMIECNLGLVNALAKPYRNCGVPLDDLVQEGTIGLIRAVEGFDHRRGFKFSTYAVWWIRRSLLDAIGAAQPIRIPAHAAQQLSAVRRAEQELEGAGIRLASADAVAARSGLSASNVRALRGVPRVTASLDESDGERARQRSEVIGDPHAAEPDDRIARDEMRREVWQMLRLLPDRYRHVLIRRYGIGGGRPESHREIGERLGVKEERSRQLEREALQRLRQLPTARLYVA
jgi:RNA polymerase primary sigma factor